MNWTLLCKRTDYPKLGYIIFRCRELGIRTRFKGSSFHALHCLEIDAERQADGLHLLSEIHGAYALDDMRDDHPKFKPFADEVPDEEVK
jgi:hypothetical protein